MEGPWNTLFRWNTLTRYNGFIIKDFYLLPDNPTTDEVNENTFIYDWGLQVVKKNGYPIEKWWQRSKSKRFNGGNSRTVWVKDRLVGLSECRITIDVAGQNSTDGLYQHGTATLERVLPSDASLPLDDLDTI